APNKDLKVAVRKEKAQRAVWNNIARAQMQLETNLRAPVKAPASETSLQLTLENKELQKAVKEYVAKLTALPDGKSDAIGYVFAVNGKINSGDLSLSNALFKKVWPVLLEGSAVEAITELKKDQKFEPVTAEAVKAFLEEVERGKAIEQNITNR